MKYKILIIHFLFIYLIQLNAQTNQYGDLRVQLVGKNENYFEFDIINNTRDTLFLFDSYLNENLYDSKYLHRFDAIENQCKLSLLSLLPFLSVQPTDCMVLGENRIVYRGQVLYNFQTILPNSRNAILISKRAFYSEDYVKEVYPQKISKFINTIKFHKSKHRKCNTVIVELALYRNIDLLISHEAYYFNEYNFNEQALSYIVFIRFSRFIINLSNLSVLYMSKINSFNRNLIKKNMKEMILFLGLIFSILGFAGDRIVIVGENSFYNSIFVTEYSLDKNRITPIKKYASSVYVCFEKSTLVLYTWNKETERFEMKMDKLNDWEYAFDASSFGGSGAFVNSENYVVWNKNNTEVDCDTDKFLYEGSSRKQPRSFG